MTFGAEMQLYTVRGLSVSELN